MKTRGQMDTDRFNRIMDLFGRACALEPAARTGFLRRECDGDEAIRAEVESMLRADIAPSPLGEQQGQDLLARQIARDETSSTGLGEPGPDGDIPILAGQYRITRVIGEGGMGVVYEAEQVRPRRMVALKALRRGPASRQLLRRFELEASILARLQHPGIAQIYEAGAAGGGRPDQAYFAMELVRGQPLTVHAAERRLDAAQRITLIIKTCDAVQHAHQRGIIHRDLKPSNILVDDTGQPKILDFGVARITDADGPSTTIQTIAGQLVGTLPYMSPEQVAADPDQVDVRSDVYALGVLLFELLAERRPFELRDLPLAEAARAIRDDPAPRLGTLLPTLRGDIETIAAKALEKDRARRYQSVADLADDLRAFLDGRPIAAKRDSRVYVVRKFIARHRVPVGAASGLAISLVAFTIYAAVQGQRNRELARLEHGARVDAQRALGAARDQSARADHEAEELRRSLYVSRIGFAQAAFAGNDTERMRRALAECPTDLRGWEWSYLHALTDGSRRSVQAFDPGDCAMVFDPAASRLYACAVYDDTAILDAADGTVVERRRMANPQTPALSPDGKTLAFSSDSGLTVVTDAAHGRERARWRIPTGSPMSNAFSPDGRSLLVAAGDGSLRVFDARTGQLRLDVPVPPGAPARRFLFCARYSPDGRLFAACGGDPDVPLYDAQTGEIVRSLHGHTGIIHTLAFSADGSAIVTGGEDGTARIWNVATGRQTAVARGHANKVQTVAFSPDGRRVVSGGADAAIRVFDAATGDQLRTLVGHAAPVTSLAFTSDGGTLISCAHDGTVRWWDNLDRPDVPTVPGEPLSTQCMAFSPDASVLATGGLGKRVFLRDGATADARRTIEHDGAYFGIRAICFLSSGDRFVTGDNRGVLTLWDTAKAEPIRTLDGHTDSIYALALSPSGHTLASASGDYSLRIWNTESDAPPLVIPTERAWGFPLSLAWLDGGRVLASGHFGGNIQLWDAASGAPVRAMAERAPRPMFAIAAADGGRLLVSASEGGACLVVWDAATGERLRAMVGHTGAAYCLAASPGGARIASGGLDDTVRVWDPLTGAELLTLRGHVAQLTTMSFSPDGARLITASSDGTLKVWDAKPTR